MEMLQMRLRIEALEKRVEALEKLPSAANVPAEPPKKEPPKKPAKE